MNVPQLRFSGFDGEWEEKELSELLEFKNGINADKDSYGHGAKFINVLDILNNDYILSENIIGSVNATEQQLKTYSVTYGDILFLRSSETREDVGKCNVYLDSDKPAVFGGFVIRGKKIADYSPFFLKALLNNSSARNQISSKSGGSTRYNVSQNILSEVTVKIPKIEEQQKVSSFFMLLNKKIEKQKERIEKLEQFKKGMMQKIFSQELRFKEEDGGEFAEWEKKKLDNCLDIENGFPFKSSYFTTEPLGMPLLRIRDIKAEKLNTYYTGSFDEKYLVNNHDIVIGMDGEFAVSKWNKGPALLNQRVMRIKSKDDYSLSYLYQLLKIVVKKIEDITPQTTVKHLSNKDIFNSIVKMPSFDEQQKIGNFFSQIDNKIEKEKEKLMVLEEQKRGFMWGMFV